MTNTLQTVPTYMGRAYSPVHHAQTDQRALDAARGRGVALVIFSYVLMGLVAVVVLPVAGKIIAAMGLLGYVLHIAWRRKAPRAVPPAADMRRPG